MNPIELAYKAKEFANCELFDHLIDQMTAECIDAWKAATSTEDREYQHLRLRAIEDFARQVRIVLENGLHAEKKLKD